MATTCITNNARRDLLNGVIDLSTDVIDCALYNNASMGYNTGAYTTVNEVVGTGYTAGGVTMTGDTQATDTTNNVSYYDWTTDPSWATSTITATECLIYDDTVTTPTADVSVYVGDFGGSRSSSAGTFTVVLPAAAYNTALIRLA
jgi:hypothetical protein